jgi:serine/threonine protein kinase
MDKGQQANANEITSCLIKQQVITKYQAEILLAGRPGPFRFGDYLVLDQLEKGPLTGAFDAIHLRTDHPVTLEFVAGDDGKALKAWKALKQKAQKWSELQSDHLVDAYEQVVLPEYRILVSQKITGSALSEKLPRKGRLPWKDACRIAAQTANGLAAVHKASQVHGSISPRCVWLAKQGPSLLRPVYLPDTEFSVAAASPDSENEVDYWAPERKPKEPPTPATDVYALGCTLHRMIRGLAPYAEIETKSKRAAHQSKEPGSLAKYKLPDQLENLLSAMLHKLPEKRPSASKLAQKLAEFSDHPTQVLSTSVPQLVSESAYRTAIQSNAPLVGSQPTPATATPAIETPDAAPARPPIDPSFEPEKSTQPLPRKQKSKTPALIVAASLLAMAGLVGVAAWWAMNIEFDKPKVELADNDEDEVDTDENSDDPGEDRRLTEPEGPGSRLVQVFVEDDGTELWETPTSGLPVGFSYLPTGVQIAMAVRPSELLENPEGARALQGLGPQFQTQADWFTTTTGLELDDIAQLHIGFCSTDQLRYSACYVVRPNEPIAKDQLVQLWRPQVENRDPESGVYDNGQGLGFYVILDPENPSMATGFAMGPVDQIKIVAELAGANPLPSNLNGLAIRSDENRHFNLLFIKNSLFNDEGQDLLSGSLAPLREYLRVHLPENLRSGLLSMHLDDGLYLETYIEHQPEIKPTDMANEIDGFLKSARDQIAVAMATAPANPYWDQVRSRFAIMVNEVYRNLRVGAEGPDVLANCWLPEIAAHNLVVGSELALTFSEGGGTTPVVQKKVPATLDALLNTKRDLSVTTNPDLGLLLAGIKTSILDDYGELPFEFDIKLIGNDLLKDGITQNQRPGDFELKQKTLAEILTEIMFRANPEKVAGPSDPECKLIWVVAEEPAGNGKPIVLITTRDAAAAKKYVLPKAFLPQE